MQVNRLPVSRAQYKRFPLYLEKWAKENPPSRWPNFVRRHHYDLVGHTLQECCALTLFRWPRKYSYVRDRADVLYDFLVNEVGMTRFTFGEDLLSFRNISKITNDTQNRPHSVGTKPAVVMNNGKEFFAHHGVEVPQHWLVTGPTLQEVKDQSNLEMRRTAHELYKKNEKVSGLAAYLRDAGCKLLDADQRFGYLYSLTERHKSWWRPVELRMVLVTNRAPELDGSYRQYALKVPVTCATAHQAVAWTFNMSPEEYDPQMES